MAKPGRPRALTLNPSAVEDMLAVARMSKKQLCDHTGIRPGHLSDALHRRKGVAREVVEKMAILLRCRPETLAPELTGWFTGVRLGDQPSNGHVPEPVGAAS